MTTKNNAILKNSAIFLCGLLCSIIIALAVVFIYKKHTHTRHNHNTPTAVEKITKNYSTLEERAQDAKAFAARKGLRQDYCIFVDYSLPSGTPRVFVWSFKENRIIAHTYTMHGPGKGSTAQRPIFSNRRGSECSSLGRFEVTKSHGFHLGRNSFRLKGFDNTNYNAWSRGLMIHSSTHVDRNKDNKFIPLQRRSCQGCITTSTIGLAYLKSLINTSSKNLLLWAFC